ncbi:MAG: TerC family protein [Crocinitomicaceae bacterium]|jgi:predicted tellurium resistance membrane protein TerC|nr:TerC family protein [Crocinitomicaceae bacterium]MBK9591360.1 TerC family protein [Crocinitomicaceae bacterium]
MFDALLTVDGLIGLFTLTILELVLGIDNIVFISIIAARLPEKEQPRARNIGLLLAMIMRVGLLFGITWVIGLKDPFFCFNDLLVFFSESWRIDSAFFNHGFAGRDLILIVGGLFLMYKSTTEIHKKVKGLEEGEPDQPEKIKKVNFTSIVVQIVLIDLVFSFDSVLTAVGLTDIILVMILAVVISIVIMMIFAKKISGFINKHPAIKMLALSFLLMIGLMLVIEGINDPGIHIPKGYVYFGMAYALVVELLNMRARKKSDSNGQGSH